MCIKNFKYVFNENTNKFLCVKKFRSVFNENTNLFLCVKNSNLYLMKIQICF